jgi:CheY-like chemotaxis protein
LEDKGEDLYQEFCEMLGEDGYTLMRQLRSLFPDQGGQIPAAFLYFTSNKKPLSQSLP